MIKVNKKILIIIAGLLWTGVGIMLIKIAYKWLITFSDTGIIAISGMGIFAGIIIAKFGFNNIAEKNIERIKQYENKVCLFAFQKWQSYLLIIVMISMGIFMKSRAFIPKNFLALMYTGIGSALFFASFRYYIRFFKCSK
ncbi:MAG: hypothetical protein L3J35_00760 [Bacteroidales bacterium]|nr:hypothetical protein [Bacteroidales bacterium]